MSDRNSHDEATAPAFPGQPRGAKGIAAASGSHAPPPTPSPKAKTFGPDGRYQVVAQLGKGGFGTVYKAYDHRLAKYVAVKAINVSDIPGNELPTYIRLFDSEAKIAAHLEHPGVVTVLDYDPYDSEPFLVMSLIEGGTLRDWFREHPRMPWPEVVDLGVQVAEALHYAHTHGVQAHRDIKPANIFCALGRYKVGDFGIARRVTVGSGVTRSTFFSAGTPRYMAPEQILTPRSVDARTDLFSLSAVLYEALTGRAPFRGITLDFDPEDDPVSANRIINAAFASPRLIRKVVPEVPPGVARAIEKALDKYPTERFRDSAAFARALQQDAKESRRSWFGPEQRRVLLRLAVLALVLLSGITGYTYRHLLEERLPIIRRLVRGGDDVELARNVAQQTIASGFATDIWNQAEARLREAGTLKSEVYRKDAVRLYWLAAVHSLLDRIARTQLLAEHSLAREYSSEIFARAEVTWQREKVAAHWVEANLIDGADSAVDKAGSTISTLDAILVDYQQATVDASRRARAELVSNLDETQRQVEELRASVPVEDLSGAEVILREASQVLAAGDLHTARVRMRKAQQMIDSLATEKLTIARARAEEVRWEAAAMRIERRSVPPKLAGAWERAEERYEEGKTHLETARENEDITAAETAVKLFEETKQMLAKLNDAVDTLRR